MWNAMHTKNTQIIRVSLSKYVHRNSAVWVCASRRASLTKEISYNQDDTYRYQMPESFLGLTKANSLYQKKLKMLNPISKSVIF